PQPDGDAEVEGVLQEDECLGVTDASAGFAAGGQQGVEPGGDRGDGLGLAGDLGDEAAAGSGPERVQGAELPAIGHVEHDGGDVGSHLVGVGVQTRPGAQPGGVDATAYELGVGLLPCGQV